MEDSRRAKAEDLLAHIYVSCRDWLWEMLEADQ